MDTFDVVIDGGNSAVKAVLIKGTKIIDQEVMPSLLRFTEDCNYVCGGARVEGKPFVFGLDNTSRPEAIHIFKEARGKIDRIKQIFGGVISTFVENIPEGSHIRFWILTLQITESEPIEDAVKSMETIEIDGKAMNYTCELSKLLPEGFGCGVSASKVYSDESEVVVFDIGGGTANLTSYRTSSNIPRRMRFMYQPSGIFPLQKFIANELKSKSSNGVVEHDLLTSAIQSNTYRMLTTYDGLDISTEVDKGIETWLNTDEMKSLITQVVFNLQQGKAVSTCGGGWMIDKVRDAIETVVLSNCQDGVKFNVTANSSMLGVLGVAELIIDENKPRKGARRNAKKAA